MKIICIGDSHTYGYGVPSKENWVSLINEKQEFDFINKGINGDTSGGMLARFNRDVIDEKPEAVIIMGGANDFIVGGSLGAVKANMMAMVHQAYYHRIVPIIGLSVQMDIENVRIDWISLADINQVYYKMMEYREWILNFSIVLNLRHIDFYRKFLNKAGEKYAGYFLDGLHLTREGHEIMADIVYQYIENLNLKKNQVLR